MLVVHSSLLSSTTPRYLYAFTISTSVPLMQTGEGRDLFLLKSTTIFLSLPEMIAMSQFEGSLGRICGFPPPTHKCAQRFFAFPKKKKERDKMVTWRGIDRHFRGQARLSHLTTVDKVSPKDSPSKTAKARSFEGCRPWIEIQQLCLL